MIKRSATAILLILLLASILRFYQIDTNPKSMYGDGLTLVYDAYSILKTGHDQKGNFLPIVFPLGGGRPGGYVYATVPFVFLFGPTQLASQMISVLSGIGIVFLLYLLGKELLSWKIGLTMAAIAAINPWELSMSRGPFESHFALFLSILGIYAFFKGLKNQKQFLLFGLCFGLGIQTYYTYGLTLPLIASWLIFRYGKYKNPYLFISVLIIAASFILSAYLSISRGSQDRFSNINIFTNPDIRHSVSTKVKNDRLLESLTPTISNQLHTPQIEIASLWAENYLKNLLPGFLYLHGDGQPRHNPTDLGGFFWVDVFFTILGIIYLYKFQRQFLVFLLGWIIIAPIPASLVGEAHALRSSFLLPPLIMLSGVGLWNFLSIRNKGKNRIVFVILILLFLVQFVYFFDRFYFTSPQKNSRFWSYPAKIASMLAFKNYQKFDYVILSNDIDNMEFAYPVYTKLDPNLVISQNKLPERIGEFPFFKYGNVYIGSLPHTRIMQFIKDLPGSVLYIGSDKEQSNLEDYKIIRGFDTFPDLIVVSKQNTPELTL